MTASVQLAAATPPSRQTIQIKLLGPPQLLYQGETLQLRRRQLRALIYRLAVALQPVPRDYLCFLLWPDIIDAEARRNLTVLLSQLRQALPLPDALIVQRDMVVLDTTQMAVDTVTLAAAVANAQSGASDALLTAIEGYIGPFLDGFTLPASGEFEAWASEERQVWERRYLDALATLVDRCAASGAYAQAITLAQRALGIDALAEDMHRWLIALFAAQGDRGAALRQFEQCALVLERELGVSPLPETRAMYEAVRAGAPSLPLKVGKAQDLSSYSAAQARAHRPAAAGRDTLRLPAPPALLIGRESDRAAAADRLFAGTGRLLTLLGPGGSGKTQLALQVAWDCAAAFADGAVFVSLAPLHDAALLAQEIGQACGIAHPNARSLAEHLRDKQQLLVLDNCEHLLQAAPSIGHLLAAAPELRILATSRSALGLHDEQTLAVAPLPLPNLAQLPALAELSQIPSVALLLARTRAHNANFQLNEDNAAEIAAICVRLDGLPLALELAAARLKLLAPHDLLRRLDQRLQLLTSGARDLPARQQTLHATIDWSYRLLDADERALFERLAVFVGSWTLAAAEAIMMPRFGKAETHPALILDTIAALVDKSLVQVIVGEESRFTMLETIREYALLRLQERGGQESVAQAHAQYFLALAELAQPHFSGPHVGDWAARIEASHDNMRAALRWILNEARDAELALRMGHALYSFWHLRGYHQEGLFALERALALSLDTQSPLRAEVFSQAGFLASALGNTQRAIILFEHCLALCRTIDAPEPHIAALNGLGIMYNRANDPRGILLLEEAVQLARNVDNPSRLCAMLRALANAQVTNGDLERGIAVYDEALQLARQHQLVRNIGLILGGLGSALTFAGQYQRALPLLDESIAHQQQLQNRPHLAWLFLFLGALHFLQDEMPAARRAFAESLAIVASLGNLNSLPDTLEGVAGVCAEGDARAAARLLGAAEALRKALGTEPSPVAQEYYARCRARVRAHLDDDTFHAALEQGRALDAATALVQARALLEA